MDINYENMRAFQQDLETGFTEGFNVPLGNTLRNVAMDLRSTGYQSVHGWLNQIPQVREWLGDRVVNNIESNKLTIVNRKFESTIEVERTEIEDDMHGIYSDLARDMGTDARDFPDELLTEALLRGQTDTWADDTAIFSNSRTYGSNTIDNLTTTAFDEDGDAFNAAFTLMMNYKGHNNKPLKAQPSYLIYGADNRTKVFKVLQSQGQALNVNGTIVNLNDGNPNAGLVIPVMSPLLVDGYVDSKGTTHSNAGTAWFLVAKRGSVSALAYQDRIPAQFQSSRLDPNSDFVFETDAFQYGTRQRGAAFITMPHLVVGNFATT